jgi:HPt (histidine-containing phosphotransfer) domain-containing protein
MDDKERLLALFAQTDIEGMDLAGGLARFGNNAKLYLKVIKSFADNIGAHLDTLAGLTEEKLADYAIEVHGVKGSCYGIGANKEGDLAKELEFAAKAEDFDAAIAGNGAFIAAVNELVPRLQALLDAAAGGEETERRAAPDREQLSAVLEAARAFDAVKMQDVVRELEKYSYERDGDLVKWLGEQVTAFAYDRIQERLEQIL